MIAPCPECNGRRGFYSDNGPAPCWRDCDWCGGSGEDMIGPEPLDDLRAGEFGLADVTMFSTTRVGG